MPEFMSLLEAAMKFRAVERDLEEAGPEIIRIACQMVAAKAKRSIGTYDLGWPALKPATIVRKANGDTPLLETGELRDSIEWSADGLVGRVGSDSDVAVWQELGTSRGIPPRSFLMLSAVDQAPKIAKMAGKVVRAAFMGHGPMASRMHDVIHALHILKDFVDDMVDVARDAAKPYKQP